MLKLEKISVYQFKNYTEKQFAFSENIIAICGLNGSGKTNLLDAIYFLCFTKSYFTKDAQTIEYNKQGLRIEGYFFKNNSPQTLTCIIRENNKKEFLLNNDEYKKFSDHIGKFPSVMVAPDDIDVINGNSDLRRKLLDTILSQVDKKYLQYLISYNKLLLQRNSVLKNINEQHQTDDFLMDTLNEQLTEKGEYIYVARKKFLEQLIPLCLNAYRHIAQSDDGIEIKYESQLMSMSFKELLHQNKQKDILLNRTSAGIHKDDIVITINQQPFKFNASQGQKKSLLFALKLAEFETLQQHNNFSPILLLDDIFEKLDTERMHHLLHRVCIENDGQVFITDTDAERVSTALKKISVPFQLIVL